MVVAIELKILIVPKTNKDVEGTIIPNDNPPTPKAVVKYLLSFSFDLVAFGIFMLTPANLFTFVNVASNCLIIYIYPPFELIYKKILIAGLISSNKLETKIYIPYFFFFAIQYKPTTNTTNARANDMMLNATVELFCRKLINKITDNNSFISYFPPYQFQKFDRSNYQAKS